MPTFVKNFFLILIFLIPFSGIAQEVNGIVVRQIVLDGDTVPFATLPTVKIYGERIFKSKRDKERYDKLVRNVKKVYPYAKEAGKRLMQINAVLSKIDDNSLRKELMKRAEEKIKEEFEEDIKNMTFSQGKILIKLIDRETGSTSYEIIKELRGSLQAFFYQAIARLFGANLKDEYDPKGDDKLIEEIVLKIEAGDL